MNQQPNIDLIEQYLNHELPEKQMAEVEAQLQSDPEMAREFARRESAHRMIDFLIAEDLRSQLKSMEAAESKVVPMVSRSRKMYALAIAASVAILLGAFFFLMPGGGLSGDQLAMQYYQSPAFTMRGENTGTDDLIRKGIDALNRRDYPEARKNLESIQPENEYYLLARYYLGHVQFLNKDYNEAMSNFALVASSEDIRLNEEAAWYQLLSCLGLKQTCNDLLDQILQNESHSYYSKALELQNKLN